MDRPELNFSRLAPREVGVLEIHHATGIALELKILDHIFTDVLLFLLLDFRAPVHLPIRRNVPISLADGLGERSVREELPFAPTPY